MSTHIILTNSAGFNTGRGDSTFIAAGAAVSGSIDMSYLAGDTGADFSGGGHQVANVYGEIFGELSDDGATAGDDKVLIGSSGSISATSESFAVELEGGSNSVVNAGSISTDDQVAIHIYGGSGADLGVRDTVVNTGVISLSADASSAGGAAVLCFQVSAADIVNSGSILASGSTTGIDLETTGNGSTIFNSGLITDGVSSGGGSVSIHNTGTIIGDVTLGDGGSSVVNTGRIDGNVQLGDATNTFNAVGGAVDGTITGGNGADTIHLGNDGETVNGGAGHDLIYGGAGADTFAFTSVLAVDIDKIFGFNVAADTIQLNHTEFAGLTAEATPVFSIDASPTSASDHLYYNSTTGWLYYDADGTGSKPSHGFANVGAGLHLTAKDFTVV